jgi:predicted Fe-Mo cluster-binding NifX family protein
MRIAIAADGPDLDDEVGHKFGSSQYVTTVDLDSGDFEAVPNPGAFGQRGAGIQAVILAVSKGVKTVIIDYCSPAVKGQLRERDRTSDRCEWHSEKRCREIYEGRSSEERVGRT